MIPAASPMRVRTPPIGLCTAALRMMPAMARVAPREIQRSALFSRFGAMFRVGVGSFTRWGVAAGFCRAQGCGTSAIEMLRSRHQDAGCADGCFRIASPEQASDG